MKHNVTAKASKDGFIQVLEGIKRKTLVYGEKTLLTEFRLKRGKQLPVHKHPQEQTGYLVSGHIILTIDGESFDMSPGDSWIIHGNIEHSAEIVEDSVAVEVFSPVREDYIPT
ncbi:cupin domain-containing protein [Candidatus Contubernalis alkaliaceticus]|uniref:cupin domain-containing protein n=1 Tax=Candidatus Contubernalis alkaliaceticus TaxID=338645 RepID=UPI001F4BED1B|nr:cupin domain-containing protein [Candidatus Contubernalis alkalaceticus]UNC91075.1 cupin domain-containing protein [Candidatus Contubernalis alkalaceticus]